jgi:hypothetical protein
MAIRVLLTILLTRPEVGMVKTPGMEKPKTMSKRDIGHRPSLGGEKLKDRSGVLRIQEEEKARQQRKIFPHLRQI